MTDPTLERLFRQVLTALEMTSNGVTSSASYAVTAVAPSRDGRKAPTPTPSFESAPPKSGDDDPPHVRYLREWESIRGRVRWRLERTTDRAGRLTVMARARAETKALLARAEDELDAIQHTRGGTGAETEDERTRRMLAEGEGHPADRVALSFRVTVAAVHRTRTSHGRDPQLGEIDITRPLGPDISKEERQRHARVLSDRYGLSTRLMAPILGVSHMQAALDLRATARASGRAAA